MAARQDFFGRLPDGNRFVRTEQTQFAVDARTGALDRGEGADQFFGHALRGNSKMPERALGLRAPQPIGGDLDGAERVTLNSGRRHGALSGPAQPGPGRLN